MSKYEIYRNDDEYFYYVYKTINIINNKIYIGIHKTKDIDDGYIGSGKLISHAIKKYGHDNFVKEYIEFYKSYDEAINKEIELVNEEFIIRNDTYNIALGGNFGSAESNGLSFKGYKHSLETKLKLSNISKNRKHSDESKLKMSINNFSKRNPEEQKRHAIYAASCRIKNTRLFEAKEKISNSLKEYNKNNKSPNLGKIREKIECPYCKKLGAKNCMIRFHFDNCKYKNSQFV